MDAALQLFAEHGYDETTVEAITERAGISPRTFYRYFEAKHGVLGDVGSTVVQQVLDDVRANGIDRPSIVTLATLLGHHIDRGLEQGPVAVVARLARQNPDLQEKAALWRQQWAQELAAGLAALHDRPSPSFEQVTTSTLAVALVAAALDEWFARGPDIGIASLMEDAVRILRTDLSRPTRPRPVQA